MAKSVPPCTSLDSPLRSSGLARRVGEGADPDRPNRSRRRADTDPATYEDEAGAFREVDAGLVAASGRWTVAQRSPDLCP